MTKLGRTVSRDIAKKRMKSYCEIAAGLSVVYTGWNGTLVGGGRKRTTALWREVHVLTFTA